MNTRIDRIVGIRQSVKAGSNFGGVAPVDGVTPLFPNLNDDLYYFAPGTIGGLFDPSSTLYDFDARESVSLLGIELTLSNQSSWKVEKVDRDGNLVEVVKGTTELSYVSMSSETDLILLWKEAIKFTTVGATNPIKAIFKFEPRRRALGEW